MKGSSNFLSKFLRTGQLYVDGVSFANVLKTIAAGYVIQGAHSHCPAVLSFSKK